MKLSTLAIRAWPSFVLVCCALLGNPAEANDNLLSPTLSHAAKAVEDFTNKEFEKEALGAISVGIVSGNKLVWQKHWGTTSGSVGSAPSAPPNDRSIYRIGSVTKQFTAVALLQLMEQDKLKLGASIGTYAKEVELISQMRPGVNPPTVFQLSTHTGGLCRDPDKLEINGAGAVANWEKSLVHALQNAWFIEEPGLRQNYSNVGFGLLGLAIQRQSGLRYDEYILQRVTKPLQMHDTAFVITDTRRLTYGIQLVNKKPNDELATAEHLGRGYRVAGGGLYSTLNDMAIWAGAQMSKDYGGLISEKTKTHIESTLPIFDSKFERGFAFGNQLTRVGNRILAGHGGIVNGYQTLLMVDTAQQLAVIVMRSVHGGRFDTLGVGTAAFTSDLANSNGISASAP